MRLLLDTHVVIWWADLSSSLSDEARALIDGDESELWLSAASVWELAIKRAIGRLRIPDPVPGAMDRAVVELPVTWRHGQHAASLPLHHRDPFDRMLVAQAQLEGMSVVTRDEHIMRYDVHVVAA